ncbi:heavy-metal-associated domain-containing protein [Ferdinandcohnia quinoae]|uniref:Heavy-metal-associated domain-containing protein n=1 Tax=Fredinandcohnia quinoae TaxID=2918902 RepID=A0AAW5E5D9_9BACI|nr:heavy-metal-associated domain-containing protein [Fredinandcohnia sp. SECRCQ15]MCH1624318.1 heavy-metal-associated domain-containing protein [Fredinandcohnia sp. SECRCQ15]
MKTVTFKMEELTCPSCIQKIEKALTNQKGVDHVSVLFNSGKVKVAYKEAIVTPAYFAGILNKLGYPVQSLKIEN